MEHKKTRVILEKNIKKLKIFAGLCLIIITIQVMYIFHSRALNYKNQILEQFFTADSQPSSLKKKVKTADLKLTPVKEIFPLLSKNRTTVLLDIKNAKVAGLDIKINYNPKTMEILEIADGTLSDITIPKKTIDAKKGLINLSLLMSPGEFMKENQTKVVVSILWQAKKTGNTYLSFDFFPNKTTDTNVAEFGTGADLLTSVTNAKYVITK